jgi:tRNA-dihydrouridine synthase A
MLIKKQWEFLVMTVDRRISVAPMMDYTDRHFRYLARLVAPHVLLYSEMITAQAIIHGDRERLIGKHNIEHPVALQLGGSDPAALAQAAQVGQEFGYQEINLNVGCPSDRVKSGCFGVTLMTQPEVVASCVKSMLSAVDIPVTVKTRLGVDHQDDYQFLIDFIECVRDAGCRSFTVHARKAWLNGLSPKENRTIPPLNYDRVYQLKEDYPDLEIIINGGVRDTDEVKKHLQRVDGVMIGREACRRMGWLHELDQCFLSTEDRVMNRSDILTQYLDYARFYFDQGISLNALVKPIISLLHGFPQAKEMRHNWCVTARKGVFDFSKLLECIDWVE